MAKALLALDILVIGEEVGIDVTVIFGLVSTTIGNVFGLDVPSKGIQGTIRQGILIRVLVNVRMGY